jgi:hypothetical protein
MKEFIVYTIAAVSSLFVLGYSVHMFVGGLVSERTETWLIAAICLLGLGAVAYMYWDVIRRRRQ